MCHFQQFIACGGLCFTIVEELTPSNLRRLVKESGEALAVQGHQGFLNFPACSGKACSDERVEETVALKLENHTRMI